MSALPQPPSHLKALDILRGLSAMAVFVAHYAQQFLEVDSLGWLGAALELLGVVGVSVFFVLSGFLIHMGVLKEQARTGGVSWHTYARRRFFRIVPAYVVALVAYSLANPHLQSNMLSEATILGFLSHLFFFSSFVPGEYQSINAIFWTVVVELHFYLMYPLLRRLTGGWSPLWVFGATWLGGMVFFFGASALTRAGEVRVMWQHTAPALFWKWTLGLLIAEIYMRTGYMPYVRRVLSLGWMLIPALIGLWAGTLFWQQSAIELNYKRFILPVFSAVLVGVFLFSSIQRWRWRLGEWLGDISYSVYLWHPLALALTVTMGLMDALSNLVVSLTMTMLISYASYQWVEKVSMNFGRKAK